MGVMVAGGVVPRRAQPTCLARAHPAAGAACCFVPSRLPVAGCSAGSRRRRGGSSPDGTAVGPAGLQRRLHQPRRPSDAARCAASACIQSCLCSHWMQTAPLSVGRRGLRSTCFRRR